MKKLLWLAFIAIVMMSTESSCEGGANEKQREETDRRMEQANSAVGMPDVKNFQELRLMKMVYELRDDASLKTYTYMKAADGSLGLLCHSIGYGLPYAAQMTNPERYNISGANLPQAEPNGLFMPDQADATWILCVDPDTGKPSPLFVEDKVIISPFPLRHVREYYAKRDVINAELARIKGVFQQITKKLLADDDDDDDDGE